MKIYERIDNTNRMIGWFATRETPTEVVQTHTMSYIGAREMYKEMGDVMGLENKLYFNNQLNKEAEHENTNNIKRIK